jgi:hypothetical protein
VMQERRSSGKHVMLFAYDMFSAKIMRRSKLLQQERTMCQFKSRGHSANRDRPSAASSAGCGQGVRNVAADCMHKATVDSSDLSVCSVNSSRQTAVAVIILAAALAADKGSLTL